MGGGGEGSHIQKSGEAVKRLDRLAPKLAPRYPRAALCVVLLDQQFKRLGNCGQTAGRIGNQFCTYNADESGNGQRLNKLAP